MAPQVLQRYDAFLGVRPLGAMWKLTQGARTLECVLTTHPLGWELRLSVGGNLSRSQVCKGEADVFDVADAWRVEAVAKGWIIQADLFDTRKH